MTDRYVSIQTFNLLTDRQDLTKALRVLGRNLKQTTQAMILASKTGRRYGKHVASAPGEAPASFTGNLSASIRVSTKGLTLKLTDTARYALSLEAGSSGGGRARGGGSGASVRHGRSGRTATTTRQIAPRPYLTAALQQTDVQTVLDAALGGYIKGRTGAAP